MNYNSFLSKDYKFLNSNSRKNNNNYKMILFGIVTVSTALFSYSLYFSSKDSTALANSDTDNLAPGPSQSNVIPTLTLDNSQEKSLLPSLVVEENVNPNPLLAKLDSKRKTGVDTDVPAKVNHDFTTKVVKVRKKDNMSTIFRRHQLSAKTLHLMVNTTRLGRQLTKLKPGQKVTFTLGKSNRIQRLKLQRTANEAIILERDLDSFRSSIEKKRANKKNSPVKTQSVKTQSVKTRPVKKPQQLTKEITSRQIVTIKKGDTLAAIFKRNGLHKTTLHQLVHSHKLGKQLTRIRPGQKIIFGFDDKKQLVSLHLEKDRIETLIIQKILNRGKNKPRYTAYIDKKEVDIRTQFSNGVIKGSFFTTAKNAGMSDAMTMKLAHLFGWDIDFALNIREGDSFSVLYEEQYLNGEKIANGDIVVAEFINQGQIFQAIRYTDAGGRTDYYTPEGYSMRKAFLRTPVAFSRISSRFSLGRKHPILNRIRAHKGVDYAAPRGTPIKATGSGKVIFKGRKGGYGKVVQIRHANKYETLYAHLSSYNRKIKRGSKVKQGQVIGYVGSTGLATGPHLHYEFRVNGVHRNPLTVKLPNADPINKKYKNLFVKTSNTLLSKLTLEKKQQLASAK